jgi:uncharacterized protein (TIGR00730 family)
MKTICVFCGSGKGNHAVYEKAAADLARILVEHRLNLIYGGGSIGLMGVMADTVLALKGRVTGIIPKFLYDLEVGHDGVTELIIVESMHDRKARMAEMADGFIALPGGFGTLEELSEIMTWIQLKLIEKPVGLLNINGYYDHFLKQLDHMVEESFLKIKNRNILLQSDKPDKLITMLIKLSEEMSNRPAENDLHDLI